MISPIVKKIFLAFFAIAVGASAAAADPLTLYEEISRFNVNYDQTEDISFFTPNDSARYWGDSFVLYLGAHGKSSNNTLDFWPVLLLRAENFPHAPSRMTINVDGRVFRVSSIPEDDVKVDGSTMTLHSARVAQQNIAIFRAIAEAKRSVVVRLASRADDRYDFSLTPTQITAVRSAVDLYGRSGEYSDAGDGEYSWTLETGECTGYVSVKESAPIYRDPSDFDWINDGSQYIVRRAKVGEKLDVIRWRDMPMPESDWFTTWFLVVGKDGEEVGWVNVEYVDFSTVKNIKETNERYEEEWEDRSVDPAAAPRVKDVFQRALIRFFTDKGDEEKKGWAEAKSIDLPVQEWELHLNIESKTLRTFSRAGEVMQFVESRRFDRPDGEYDVYIYRWMTKEPVDDIPLIGADPARAADYFAGRHSAKAENGTYRWRSASFPYSENVEWWGGPYIAQVTATTSDDATGEKITELVLWNESMTTSVEKNSEEADALFVYPPEPEPASASAIGDRSQSTSPLIIIAALCAIAIFAVVMALKTKKKTKIKKDAKIADDAPTKRFCTKCGEEIGDADANFCSNCGAPAKKS